MADIEPKDGGYDEGTSSSHGNEQNHPMETLFAFSDVQQQPLETLPTSGESQRQSLDGDGKQQPLETLFTHGGDQQQPLDTIHEEITITDFKLSDEKIKEYREAFMIFDKDESNTISKEELKTVLKSLGKDHTDEEVEEMIAEVEKNENGEIEFDEFIRIMENEDKTIASEQLIKQAFDVLDTSGNGFISRSRLTQVVRDIGLQITDDEIDEMMNEADPNGDGKVNYDGLIGLLSTDNDTLSTAYKKRVQIEEMKKADDARREAERIEEDRHQHIETVSPEDANGMNNSVLDKEEEDTKFEIPDMDDIASQFDSTHYNKFSRQTPTGGRIVKRTGQRVPMSRTRLMYLQRKNRTPTANESEVKGVIRGLGSIQNLTESADNGRTSVTSGVHTNSKSQKRFMSDHDERKEFEIKHTSNPPVHYRNVQSRLKDPKYYLKKQNKQSVVDSRAGSRYLRAISVEFESELKQTQEKDAKPVQGSPAMDTSSNTCNTGAGRRQPKAVPQSYVEKLKVEAHNNEYKVYYAVWRSAFTKALDKLRQNKKLKSIQLKTPEVMSENKKRERQQKGRRTFPRMSVISPSLYTARKSLVEESTSQVLRPVLNRGSYMQNFRKSNAGGLTFQNVNQPTKDRKVNSKPQHQNDKFSHLRKRGDDITKSTLDKMIKI